MGRKVSLVILPGELRHVIQLLIVKTSTDHLSNPRSDGQSSELDKETQKVTKLLIIISET